jgi:hypothetical protein
VLTITGTASDDQFRLQLKSGDAATLQVTDNGTTRELALADVTRIDVSGLGGDDTLTVNLANGLVGLAGGLPLNFVGGAGTDTLRLSGDPGAGLDTTISAGANAQAGTLTAALGGSTLAVTFSELDALIDTSTGDLTVNATEGRDQLRIGNGPTIDGLATNTIGAGNNTGKVAVNHQTGSSTNPTVLLFVDEHAADAHLRHGDTLADLQGPNGDASSIVPITFANKAEVTANALGGDDVFTLAAGLTGAAGLTDLTLSGGAGLDTLVARGVPAGVTLALDGVERRLDGGAEILIHNLYNELLRRTPSDAELDGWLAVLRRQGAQAVIAGIAGSAEARAVVVRDWYVQFLGRAAATGEEQGWVQALTGGATEEQVLSSFLSSAEFRARADALVGGASSDENYVRALYQLLLNRDPESQGVVNAWVSAVGSLGRQAVALSFLRSAELRAAFVTDAYLTLLERTPSRGEVNGWVRSGLDLFALRVAILASAEFDRNG